MRSKYFFVLLAAFLLITNATAQNNEQTVAGTVKDQTGASVTGANVSL
jgi:hypothetical protein